MTDLHASRQDPSRLHMELELLEAMYPDQTEYNPRSRELRFTFQAGSLVLRLPDNYPESTLPDIISATDPSKNDIRDETKSAVKELGLAENEEALDAIIAAFQQIVEKSTIISSPHTTQIKNTVEDSTYEKPKTVVIWLHHLLNTNKRKLALSPPSQHISGLTKPGYPGILVYSGSYLAVTEHVGTLRAQNWQAFQVRYEEETLWQFSHGKGVKEVESMAEVVKGVDFSGEEGVASGKGVGQKEEFLKAVGIK
ncbi:hypothetical protein IQ07DRAFT_617519 [Pyrenochaeta sp. DS3sAY3a]|nr:hypothetical protein IQ07DRAFT_617519 [Pyrenochaeta sp. DS3sAY3a]